ncbi:MAG TPA: hypothetical protein VIK69_04190, partial [Methylophilaceae bacterium]
PARPPQPGTGAPGSPRRDAAHGGVNYALRRVQEIGSGSPAPLRSLEEIRADILKLEQQTEGLLQKIIGGVPA